MRKFFAISVSKIILWLIRLLGKSGSSLPGLVAERIKPDLLSDFSGSFTKGIIMVTGTNGKTTTTKMIVGLLEGSGYRVFTNKSGSNFTRGIISALIKDSSLSGKTNFDYAVIESDEAYSRLIAKELKPRVLLVTNIMRDQLDRYGEIDHTANLILEAANLSSGVVLNRDDPPVAAIGERVDDGVEVSYFAASSNLKEYLPTDEELLGGKTKVITAIKSPAEVMLEKVEKGQITLSVKGVRLNTKLQFEGVHNALNATSAIATILKASPKANLSELLLILPSIKPAFGRGEKIELQGRTVHIALAKNPGGFNQNIRTFLNEHTRVVLILINDNYADSRDVSWIWDVDFSPLKDKDTAIILGGNRAFDMALRLQYLNIKIDEIDQSINVALEHALSAGSSTEDVVVFPTYTAMLELRKILKTYTKEVEDMW